MTQAARLRHIAKCAVSNVDKKSVDGERAIRLCNYVDVYYNNHITDAVAFMDATATTEQIHRFTLRAGDVVFTKDSEIAADIAVPAFVPADLPGVVCGYHLAVARPRPSMVDGRYLFWVFASMPTRDHFAIAATGVTRFGLRQDSVGDLPVPLPNLAQQRAIADFLDTETARIDALITKKRRLIELLAEADRALVDDVFGRSYERSTVRLARLARLQTGLTLDSARGVESGAVTLPYLRVANVQADRVDLAEIKEVTVPSELADRCRLRPGDVLMTEGGDLDKLGRGTVWAAEIPECLHQNHVFAVRPDRARLLPEFLAMLTRTSFARKYFESTGTRSTNLASTNSSKVLGFRVPLVGVEWQRTALDRYAQRAGRLIQCGRALAEQIDLLVEHRQALITAAVTGELEIPGVAA